MKMCEEVNVIPKIVRLIMICTPQNIIITIYNYYIYKILLIVIMPHTTLNMNAFIGIVIPIFII